MTDQSGEPWMREAEWDKFRTANDVPIALQQSTYIRWLESNLDRFAKHAPASPVPESASGTCPTCFGFVNKCGHSKMRVYSQPCNDGSGMSMTICGPCQSASNSVTWPSPSAEKGKKP